MKKQLYVFIVTLFICLSAIVTVHNDFSVEATGGGGGDEITGLDYDYMWNITYTLSRVVHDVYNNTDIRKGREFGSKGDIWTANYLRDRMDNDLSLQNVTKIKIEPIDGMEKWYYNYKVDTIDFKLTINGEGYEFQDTVPKNESFAQPTGVKNSLIGTSNYLEMDYKHTFTDLKIVPRNLTGPFYQGIDYDVSYYNLSCEGVKNLTEIIGNVSYIPINESIPEEQEAHIFLLEEEENVENQLDNISSNVSGVILIHNNSRENQYYANTTSCNVSVGRINITESNLSAVIELLQNGTLIIGENINDYETFTFYYNFTSTGISWGEEDFFYVSPCLKKNIGAIYANTWLIMIRNYFEYFGSIDKVQCHGVIMRDFCNETHLMAATTRHWKGWGQNKKKWDEKYNKTQPYLQLFYVNKSVGKFLEDNYDEEDVSVTGYLEQADEWVEAYNVLGNITIDHSPNDEITVISNRYDGFWGECPGDSGAGAGIVLGIAKYFKDNSIKSKYNLTFLFTTGEEYGMRGAWHYSHTHPEEDYNITQWIGTDQLGFNTPGTIFEPLYNETEELEELEDILELIANDIDYTTRTGYGFNTKKAQNPTTDDWAIRARSEPCNVVCVHKSGDSPLWPWHHRSGMNFSEGDSMNNQDRNDLNVTFEYTWNVVKYFCVNPDSWLTNIQYEPIDSPNDGDTLIDSIRANFTINTILPHDNVMVEVLYDKFWETGGATNIHYAYVNYTVNSSGCDESIIFTIPYGDSQGDYAVKIRLYNSTGRINEMVGIGNNNYNDSDGSSTYNLSHPFGYPWKGALSQNTDDRISGSVFKTNEKAYVENITAYVYSETQIPAHKSKCMIYRKNDSKLIGTTDELSFGTALGGEWKSYPFSDPKPALSEDTEYVLVHWSDGVQLYYDNYTTSSSGRYNETPYGASPPDLDFTNENRIYSIYCCYMADDIKPEINNVTSTPDPVGFGMSENIYADVTDTHSGVNTVKVNITCPNMTINSYTMTNIQDDTYKYVFNNTWKKGQYSYHIWAIDNNNNSNTSDFYSFNVSGQANITVCTLKDSYGGNETVNLTDPPGNDPPLIGYELLDNDEILHIWNQYNSYYFNTSNGIQFTNHYNEYWTHNVLMLGYYNNNQWNLIYRTDELSGFNKNINTDNTTYVNATLWKDLTYMDYDFRLAIRYYLGVEDTDLTIIPYIKNIDDEDIPYNLGFGWEIKDIQIANVESDNYLQIFNGTGWENILLSQTLDKTFTDMDHNNTISLICTDPPTNHLSRDLYLSWNENLNYKVTCKSRTGQYNAPVSLFIKIGTLDVNQEKYTQMHWLDSDDWLGITGSNRDSECGYDQVPQSFEAALNGTGMWAHGVREIHWGIVDLGQTYTIKKVRGRSNFLDDPIDVDIYVSDNKSSWGTAVATGISTWQDTSSWVEIDTTDKDGRYIKIEIIDTEGLAGPQFLSFGDDMSPFQIFDAYGDTPSINNAPEVSNPNPPSGSTGVPTTPMLNITVSDADGDTMNITWLSNSSDSWQVFGTNYNVNNGTYYQNMTNASVNAQWWYWKVNVTDGINYTESNVFSFYTGCESKIVNTGSTSIKGYLLIQVQFYSNSSTWVVADDTINETSPRTVPWEDPGGTPGQHILALDTIFNDLVNTNNLSGYGNGTYRIYAALRDPDGNVLICDDSSEMVATYEFTVIFE